MLHIISLFLMSLTEKIDLNGGYATLVEDNLALIDRAVAFVAHRQGLSADHREALGARVKMKLVDRDYEVLRRFEGRSSLKSYLVVIAKTVCLDYRNQLWGKWRPSKPAQRLGPLAILLEQAMSRDGMNQEEAVAHLLSDPSVTLNEKELHSLAEQLPQRAPRRSQADLELDSLPASDPNGEQSLLQAHKRQAMTQLESTLTNLMAENTDEDQLIVRMHYHESLKVSQISHMLGIEQKKLYRRLNGLLSGMRQRLEAAGHSRQMVVSLLREG